MHLPAYCGSYNRKLGCMHCFETQQNKGATLEEYTNRSGDNSNVMLTNLY